MTSSIGRYPGRIQQLVSEPREESQVNRDRPEWAGLQRTHSDLKHRTPRDVLFKGETASDVGERHERARETDGRRLR